MSIWYYKYGLPWKQYLQADAIVTGIGEEIKKDNKAIRSTISEQTKKIVASNEELIANFDKNFDTINKTIRWGFDSFDSSLQNIETSIETLHADFNYSMGLLLEVLVIQNEKLNGILNKLDAIHKTLESPLLTQAREYYRIGCDRLSKGLLKKALEAFLEAEKKNDADFFTQNRLGMLYLYGINEDDDVINLTKAKMHLLQAARYGKAELKTDPLFSRLLAEIYLHVSIANYALIEENKTAINNNEINSLLKEAKESSKKAIEYNSKLIEALYHNAKYCSLLLENEIAINNLRKCVEADRNYAVKVDIDPAFNSIRDDIYVLLEKLRKEKMTEAKTLIDEADKIIHSLHEWNIFKDNRFVDSFTECKNQLDSAKNFQKQNTYFSFLDSISSSKKVISISTELFTQYIEKLKNDITTNLNPISSSIDHKIKSSESLEAIELFKEAKSFCQKSYNHLEDFSIYDSYIQARKHAIDADHKYNAAEEIEKNAIQERLSYERQKEKKRKHQELINHKIMSAFKWGILFSISFGIITLIIGGLFECVDALNNEVGYNKPFGGSGESVAISGFIIGAIAGVIKGLFSEP